MPTSYRKYAPEQSLLLPPSLRDWLPEGHLVHFISDVVDQLDLEAFYRRYAGDGRRKQPFEPQMMVKVLLYGYANGTFSSRKLAKRIEEDVAFRMLAGGNFPSHRTIADFRKLNLEAFQDVFVQVVRFAQEAGLVRMGTIATDGTKVKANASKHKAMSYGRMVEEEKRLEKEIADLTKQAELEDAQEDAEFGEDVRGDELPEDLRHRESRLKKIKEAKERLEQRQTESDKKKGRVSDDGQVNRETGRPYKRRFGVPPDRAQENFTDTDSRIMKTGDGFNQCYNGQIVVDDTAQIIVANRLTQSAADSAQLLPNIVEAFACTGVCPSVVLADAGYRSEENFVELEACGVDGYVSLGREGKRTAAPNPSKPATSRINAKLATRAGKDRYRKRKSVVEPVFGWIKHALGFRQFLMRGFQRVRGEWNLVCLAVNLKRLQVALAA
jgi:transposase